MGGHAVRWVGVESLVGAVVAHGGAWVGVADSCLDVADVDVGGACGGDEGVAQAVRGYGLLDTDLFGKSAYDPCSVVAVETSACTVNDERPAHWLAVDGPGFDMCA
jgi:hypothetical protein